MIAFLVRSRTARRWACVGVWSATIALAACAGVPPESDRPDAGPGSRPTATELNSLTYAGIYENPVTLEGGIYEGPPFMEGSPVRPRLVLVRNGVRYGDLDGDGIDDAVVALEENSGGTGHFLYLAAVRRDGDSLRNVATIRVGDRVQVRHFSVSNGQVVLETIEGGDGDAACCPTHLARHRYSLVGGSFEDAREDAGVFSLDQLRGTRWRLTHLGWDEPVAGGVEVTLTIGDDGFVSGNSGCNQFRGPMRGNSPRDLDFGPVVATRRGCEPAVMAVESAFFTRLEAAQSASFVMERLALFYVVGDRADNLLFEPLETHDEESP